MRVLISGYSKSDPGTPAETGMCKGPPPSKTVLLRSMQTTHMSSNGNPHKSLKSTELVSQTYESFRMVFWVYLKSSILIRCDNV